MGDTSRTIRPGTVHFTGPAPVCRKIVSAFEMKNVAKVIDHIRQTRYNKQEETAEDTPQDARPAVNLISEEISL